MRFSLLNKINPANRILDKAIKLADLVIAKEDEYKKYSLEQLRQKTDQFVNQLASKKVVLDDILIDALCVIREAIDKVYGMRAFKVQLIGAIIVFFGDFAEMMTGEGKTLTIALASYVVSLTSKGVHIVSVNEYLVERDAQFSSAIMNPLGLTVGYIKSSMNPHEKKQNYNCDITYCSNSELGFDYLRDNMVENYHDKVQRELNFAIIDEADSILIDECRTPLIISGAPNGKVADYVKVDQFAKSLKREDYLIDLESSSISLSDSGAEKAQKFFNVDNIYDLEFSSMLHKLLNALKANYLFFNGKEYIVRKNDKGKDEIALVDQFTGRIMADRSYSNGLHQAIQAKEYVEIDPENLTVATITYQSFFRLYNTLSGVSGTAFTESEELLSIYNMVVVKVPTNRPVVRMDKPDYVFGDKKTKWKYVVAEIIKRHKTGQPILVGTAAVEDSEILHLLLQRVGIPHQVLNAKYHAQEAEIIKNAGQLGQVTIATYMAGRGTDIKLAPGVKELGGLYVIGTERNESRRIDNQLRGRSGRQGDPGESRFFISLQDTLFKRFATDKFQKANNKMEDEFIDLKFFSRLLDNTQKKVEGLNYDMRKNLIDYDHVLSSQRELLYKQRDKVLLAKDLLSTLLRMIPHVAEYLIDNNLDATNQDFVNTEVIINELNNNYFKQELLDYKKLKNYDALTLRKIIIQELSSFIKKQYQLLTPEAFNRSAKSELIANLDRAWTEHLEAVSKLREGVNLRAYEQKSPLNIYVEDADKLYEDLKMKVALQTVKAVSNFGNLGTIGDNIFNIVDLQESLNKQAQQLSNQTSEPDLVLETNQAEINRVSEIRVQNNDYLGFTFNNDNKKFIYDLIVKNNNLKSTARSLDEIILNKSIDDVKKVLS